MLHIVRGIFIVISALIGWYIGQSYGTHWLHGTSIGAAIATAFVLLEAAFTRRFVTIISTVMFGCLVGFIVSFFFIKTMYLIPSMDNLKVIDKNYMEFSMTFLCCFISIVTIIHSKDDFKFVIPFVELSREGRSGRAMILDTSVIIDGRIADICETKIIDSPLIVPRFVLIELQSIADSADKLKRVRGRRGLDILNRMRKSKVIDLQVNDTSLPPGEEVDSKLVHLAKMIDAKIVTNDFNLNKMAQVQGLDVININDIAGALRPVFLQGERMIIKIVKSGEAPGQGVGYLDDGTMVVAEDCSRRLGERVALLVTNVLQTSAGKMIFAKYAGPAGNQEWNPRSGGPAGGE